MAHNPPKSPLLGRWSVTSTISQLDNAATLDSFFDFWDTGRGVFRFCQIEGAIDWKHGRRDGEPCIEWTWAGGAAGGCMNGRGWAREKNGRLEGWLAVHLGAAFTFIADCAEGPNRAKGTYWQCSEETLRDNLEDRLKPSEIYHELRPRFPFPDLPTDPANAKRALAYFVGKHCMILLYLCQSSLTPPTLRIHQICSCSIVEASLFRLKLLQNHPEVSKWLKELWVACDEHDRNCVSIKAGCLFSEVRPLATADSFLGPWLTLGAAIGEGRCRFHDHFSWQKYHHAGEGSTTANLIAALHDLPASSRSSISHCDKLLKQRRPHVEYLQWLEEVLGYGSAFRDRTLPERQTFIWTVIDAAIQTHLHNNPKALTESQTRLLVWLEEARGKTKDQIVVHFKMDPSHVRRSLIKPLKELGLLEHVRNEGFVLTCEGRELAAHLRSRQNSDQSRT